MISVVIPVYNVKNYIDRCLDSVVNQTFRDFEIILINDGSTDGSAEKCEEWALRDKRVRYISKQNEGLGPTRNLGIREAKYDYIAFLDSDDWWDHTMLEKMRESAVENDSDMVICDRYDAFPSEYGGDMRLRVFKLPIMFSPVIDDAMMKHQSIIHIVGNSAWGRLYKRKLFTENNIYMPHVYCEDAAIMPYLTTFCKRISCVREPLYYYLQKREGSILNSMDAAKSMITCLEYVRKTFIESGKMEEYYESVKFLAYEFTIGTGHTTKNILTKENEATRDQILSGLHAFIDKNYPDIYNLRIIFGSYNLRRSVTFGFPMLEDKRRHYMGMSLISMFAEPINVVVVHHNKLRGKWLTADLCKSAQKDLSSVSGRDLVFIDFLEEAWDIAECNGSYFTLSEAFEDVGDCFPIAYTRISRFDKRVEELWRSSCDKFIAFLKDKFNPEQIVLAKMYLSEYRGEYHKEEQFGNIERIREANALLQGYYDYFAARMEGITVMDCVQSNMFFTDASFNLGAEPYHLNMGFYATFGTALAESVRNKNMELSK